MLAVFLPSKTISRRNNSIIAGIDILDLESSPVVGQHRGNDRRLLWSDCDLRSLSGYRRRSAAGAGCSRFRRYSSETACGPDERDARSSDRIARSRTKYDSADCRLRWRQRILKKRSEQESECKSA